VVSKRFASGWTSATPKPHRPRGALKSNLGTFHKAGLDGCFPENGTAHLEGGIVQAGQNLVSGSLGTIIHPTRNCVLRRAMHEAINRCTKLESRLMKVRLCKTCASMPRGILEAARSYLREYVVFDV